MAYQEYYFKMVGNSQKNIDKMDSNFLARFNSMCKDFYELTKRQIIVTRTFTTKEEQENLYKKSLEDKTSFKNNPYPMTLHCYGRAIDIQPIFTDKLISLGLLEKYGFVAPFSNEKRHIQNINESDKNLANAGDGNLFKEPIRSRGGDSLDSVDVYLRKNLSRGIPKNILNKIENKFYTWSELNTLPEFLGGVDKKYAPYIERYQNYLQDVKELKNAVKNKKITEKQAIQGLKEMYGLQDGLVKYHDEAIHKSTSFLTNKKSTIEYVSNKEKTREKAIADMISSIEQLKTRGTDIIKMVSSVNSIEDAKELEEKSIQLHNDIINTIEKKLGLTFLSVNDKGVWSFRDNITGESFEFSQSGFDKAMQTIKSNAFATTFSIAGSILGSLLGPAGTIAGGMLGTYAGSFIDSYISSKNIGENLSLSEYNDIALDAALTDGIINALTFGAGKLIKSFSLPVLKPLFAKAKRTTGLVANIFKKSGKEATDTLSLSLGKETTKNLYTNLTGTSFKFEGSQANKLTSGIMIKEGEKLPYTFVPKKSFYQKTKDFVFDSFRNVIRKSKNTYNKFKSVGRGIRKFGGIVFKKILSLATKIMEKRSLNKNKGFIGKKTTMVPITDNGKVYYIWSGDYGKDYKKLIKDKKLKEYKLTGDESFSSLKAIEIDYDKVYKEPITNKKYEEKLRAEERIQKIMNNNSQQNNYKNSEINMLNNKEEPNIQDIAIGEGKENISNIGKNKYSIINNNNSAKYISRKETPKTKNISSESSIKITNDNVSNGKNVSFFNNIDNSNTNIQFWEQNNQKFTNSINMKDNSKMIKEFNT